MNEKTKESLFDLFKVIRETAIKMDLPSKQDTIIKCEWYMDRLKPGRSGAFDFSNIFDEVFKAAGKRNPHAGPLADDYFKNL